MDGVVFAAVLLAAACHAGWNSVIIAVWAMTAAPIALVAALRETSILFATAIAVVVLKEPLRPARLAAAA